MQLSMSDTSLAWGESLWEDDSKSYCRQVFSTDTKASMCFSMESVSLKRWQLSIKYHTI